ncbi:MAG: hypothetical protein ACOVS5_14575 [Oligoflexus sp.]|jgi:hypothetical protein
MAVGQSLSTDRNLDEIMTTGIRSDQSIDHAQGTRSRLGRCDRYRSAVTEKDAGVAVAKVDALNDAMFWCAPERIRLCAPGGSSTKELQAERNQDRQASRAFRMSSIQSFFSSTATGRDLAPGGGRYLEELAVKIDKLVKKA